jgi:hypothetical protein
LFEECVYNRLVTIGQWSLAQERELTQNREESLKVLGLAGFVSNALKHLRKKYEIHDNGSGKQRVLASIVDNNSVGSVEENLVGVLIKGTLGVPNSRDVLDHHYMVGMLAFFVKHSV